MRGKLRDFLLHSEKRIHTNDDQSSLQDKQIVYELKKIGTNINQIAFKINVGDFAGTDALAKHLADLERILRDKLS